MNYATQNHIGNNQRTRTATTTAITPTIGQVRRMDADTKRRKRNTKRQTEIRTNSNATNSILKCTFLPKLKEWQTAQDCRKTTEREFYHSLSIVTQRYHIKPMQTKGLGYPYNVALSLWDIQTKLKDTYKTLDTVYLAQSRRKTFLATPQRFNTDTTLYYVPVIPLFKMLKDPKRKKNAHLLLSVCSYLYRIANVPYYREEESYLCLHYDMHKEWIANDTDTDESETFKNELDIADYVGDKIEKKLRNPTNLKLFKQRVNYFKSRDTFDHECWQTAYTAFALYSDYPTASIFRNAPIFGTDPYNDDYDNETIGMEKYISFVADTSGWLYKSIQQGINSEFNECGTLEEPTLFKPMDGSRITGNHFDFEKRFFELLNKVCGLLYDYKTI